MTNKESSAKVRLAFLLIVLMICVYLFRRHTQSNPIVWTDYSLKKTFENIYENKIWGEVGGRSGGGSTLEYTIETRKIVYEVVLKYKINSILDAPCGSLAWMPEVLANLTNQNIYFKYHGVDLYEKGINNLTLRFRYQYPNWKFSVLDLAQHSMPAGYDLIFSRDALQHLPLVECVKILRSFSRAKHSRYLLIGSYMTSRKNENIEAGSGFQINTINPPFNLTSYVTFYKERYLDDQRFQKFLILYDIKNYLSKINYDEMLEAAKNMTKR